MSANPIPGSSTLRLLAIDDDPAMLDLITAALSREGLEILRTTDPEEGLRLVKRTRPHLVLLDLQMPKLNGMELLEKIVELAPGTDVIMMTGDYSTESAVAAIQKGAADYLHKPLPLDKLRDRIEGLLADTQKWQRGFHLESELVDAFEFEGMVGRSPLMLEVFNRIRRVAPHFRTVLVTGATGTGKELVARALHKRSPVATGPFVICNCSALVETLLESELFGHVKGSFTGATQDKMGMFEYANGGTLFLDEIGEMPLTMQAKLLRVVQFQEIQRVGSPAVRKVTVRVVAATHRDLHQMAAENQFRQDLYFRLSMVEIQLPRLAERIEDLPLLERLFLQHFAQEFGKPISSFTRRAQALLAGYPWPGNVRELENAIGHACMLADGDTLDVRDLPQYLRQPKESAEYQDEALVPLGEAQRRHVRRVLERMGGNKARAAEILKVSRGTLYRVLGEVKADANEVEVE